ncbi:hypothetical protein AKJ65_03275 [candidate division MSBL1 archaeon SCGC-AAA259E19]|uniref:Uncharacterized protein n=2 Tax=candidate division MSBL1 TaxID=215777 RepID=A0A133UZ53_9EURY|nr:hypothetical protein AKJ65_03275 [candidate division MSBL1 archaeon SCGC-AAA259E19]KXA99476.1 hypothetical protein AKJ41_05365 [candidate division MSBL1 archaeon SCGC-AAA259O05]
MNEIDSNLSRMHRQIVKSARRLLPEIAEKECPAREGDICKEIGEKCGFSICPMIERIADEDGC